MLDYRNILRVSSDPDKSLRTMEQELHSSHHTIKKVLEAAQRAGITWPLPDTMTNEMLMELLFPEEYQKTVLYAVPRTSPTQRAASSSLPPGFLPLCGTGSSFL